MPGSGTRARWSSTEPGPLRPSRPREIRGRQWSAPDKRLVQSVFLIMAAPSTAPRRFQMMDQDNHTTSRRSTSEPPSVRRRLPVHNLSSRLRGHTPYRPLERGSEDSFLWDRTIKEPPDTTRYVATPLTGTDPVRSIGLDDQRFIVPAQVPATGTDPAARVMSPRAPQERR